MVDVLSDPDEVSIDTYAVAVDIIADLLVDVEIIENPQVRWTILYAS